MRRSLYILSLLLFSTLIQCGSDTGPSSGVGVTITPAQPNVVTSDVVITGSDSSTVTITAPLIAISMNITNDSSETLIVTGVRFEATYRFTDAKGVTSTLTAGPTDVGASFYSSFGYDALVTKSGCTTTAGCDQTILAQIPSKSSLTPSYYTTTAAAASALTFYFPSLPQNDGKNYTYIIKMTLRGYFGSSTNITNRLTKIVYFTTI